MTHNESNYQHGLVFGKFYPYHKGHEFLVRSAIEQSEHVTVIVCSLLTETIPGVLRHAWVTQSVKEMLKEPQFEGKTVSVLHLDKTVPQEPKEHPDFWKIWTDLLEGYLDEKHSFYDALFTSEDYGYTMAEHLHCTHVLVDKERSKHPVSGTLCRKEMYENQNALNPQFTRFFKEYVELQTKEPEHYDFRVVVVGSESCGKSTMVKNLSERFNAMNVEEYGRDYTNEFDITGIEDFYLLLQKQLHLFLHTKKEPGKESIMISDTDAIVTKTFADLYYPIREKEFDIQATSHILAYKKHADFYVFLKPTVKWVDDGTREFEAYREFATSRIKEQLDSFDIPYIEIDGTDYDERTEKAFLAIKEKMKEKNIGNTYSSSVKTNA